jgi:hypothetical protein
VVDHEETEREILRLVNEADGRDRAMLLLIYRMHQELVSNTIATRQVAASSEEHAKILSRHAEDEMGLINQIRGGWRTATVSFGIIGGLVTVILGGVQWFALREMNAVQSQIAINTGRIYSIESENAVQRDQLWSIRQHLRGLNGSDK